MEIRLEIVERHFVTLVHPHMKRITQYLFLSGILLSFTLLATHRWTDLGLYYHDNGTNILEAKFVVEGFQALRSVPPGTSLSSASWDKIKESTSGVPPHVGKPGFTLIVALAGALIGFRDNLLATVTILFAVANIFLAFLITRKMCNAASALYAAAVLASSTFFLLYARSGLPEQVVTFFFLLGLLLFLHSLDRKTSGLNYLAGFAIGYAFCSNHWRTCYMLGILLGAHFLAVPYRKWGWKSFVSRSALFVTGFLTPPLVFQIPYWVAELWVGPLPFRDYFGQLQERFYVKFLGWFKDTTGLIELSWEIERPATCFFMLAAWIFLLVRAVIKRSFYDTVLFFFLTIPCVYFSTMTIYAGVLPRTVSSLIPLAAISVGQLLWAMQSRLEAVSAFWKRHQGLISALLIVAVLAWNYPRTLRTAFTRSGYKEASAYLAGLGEKKFMILALEPVWRFYLGRVAYEPQHPKTLDELIRRARLAGIRYAVADVSTMESQYLILRSTADIAKRVKPVAKFSNPMGSSLAYLLDTYCLHPSRRISSNPLSNYIYVFDIEDIAAAFGGNNTRAAG